MGLLDKYNSYSGSLGSNLINDLKTSYPSTTTGTPTPTANPGGPAVPYSQTYNSANTYLSNISSNIVLTNTLNITNLDTENPGVDGGIPYKPNEDPTTYPLTSNHVTDTRGFFPEPSEPAQKFNQSFNPNNTYLNFIKSYT